MRLRVAIACTLIMILALGAHADEPYATLLAKECDALVASAIKRPYGWAWPDAQNAQSAQKLTNRPVSVSLDPCQTPTAGLLLWYSARLLSQPKYADAARNVARGVAAAQTPSGKFPLTAYFGSASATSKERSILLPDRASTRAALALLLTVIDGANDDQELLKRSANRGVAWLLHQQSEPGGWPSLYPPGAAPKDAIRVVRLDTPAFRDDIYTMLLAYEVLGDPFHRRSAERSVEFLIKVRSSTEDPVGAGLWESAYTLPGLPMDKAPDFPSTLDLVASRCAVQSLLGAWLILGDGQRLVACNVASDSIDKLIEKGDGHWHRRFNATGESIDPQSADQTQHFFGTPNEQAPPPEDDLLAPTMRSVALAQQLGREKLREQLNQYSTPRQQLAQVISGLTQELLEPENLEAAVKQQSAQLRLLEKAADADPIKRLWTLYQLAKLERQLDNH